MNTTIGPETVQCPIPIMEITPHIQEFLSTKFLAGELNKEPSIDDIRSELGYPPAEDVDTSGLIDIRAVKSPVIPPILISEALPLTQNSANTTLQAREDLANIYTLTDSRLVVALGECAIYNVDATLDYALHVKRFIKLFPNLKILQRTFFEKPRTFKPKGSDPSWKGFMYDPHHDGSDDINFGVIAARMLALRMTDMGIPLIKEQLNALTPQYLDGLIAQDNIGARNAYDQKAMEYGSATSAIPGFKNPLDGVIEVSAAAAATAHSPQTFLGVSHIGTLAKVRGLGNPYAHFILRGSDLGPNYLPEHVQMASRIASEHNLLVSFAIDASHGNSNKDAANQLIVVENVGEQIGDGNDAIRAMHLETALVGGHQKRKMGQSLDGLVYGQSITDDCAGLDQTEHMLNILDEKAAKRREKTLRHRSTFGSI